MKASVQALRQQLETLFPGKWVDADVRQNTLLTGLQEIDHSLTRGIARQRITEWLGAPSSGKTTILRAIISQWCASGFDVAYIDAENKLVAADWACIDQGVCQPELTGPSKQNHKRGKFWVIRNLESSPGLHSFPRQVSNRHGRPQKMKQNHLWAADELIRVNAFDVVILDLGFSEQRSPMQSRVYARLQNSLGKSRTALVILRDTENTSSSDQLTSAWGSHAQLAFHWGANINCLDGLNGTATIAPSISCAVSKNGLSQGAEVTVVSHVANRLFTHSPVSDRRTPKTG